MSSVWYAEMARAFPVVIVSEVAFEAFVLDVRFLFFTPPRFPRGRWLCFFAVEDTDAVAALSAMLMIALASSGQEGYTWAATTKK